MDEQKSAYKEVGGKAIMAHTNLMSLPSMGIVASGLANRIRPNFNVVVSNVRGPDRARYLRGARLEEFVPMSVLFDGYRLNITGISYAGNLQICLLVCPESVPDAGRICEYINDAVDSLAA